MYTMAFNTFRHKYHYMIYNYREFRKIRNYATYRCFKTKNTVGKHVDNDELHLIDQLVHGKFTYCNKHFYFECEDDILIFRLAYP